MWITGIMKLEYTFPFTLGSQFPENVYIEATNNCNLKCIMCPHGHGMLKNKGHMSKETFFHIIDDLLKLPIKPKIALHITGEPFLNKSIFDFISYCSHHQLFSFLHTNGTLLDQDKTHELIKCGLNEITFSFEGEQPDNYNRIRKGADWNTVVNNIQYLLKMKDRPHVIIEILKFRTIDTTLSISKDFQNMFPGAAFHSYYASDWRGTLNDIDFLKEEKDLSDIGLCKLPLNDMAISWDGEVKVCTIDYNTEFSLGSIKDNSIMDIWLGLSRKEFLTQIYHKDYQSINVCKSCNAPYYAHKKERNWVE